MKTNNKRKVFGDAVDLLMDEIEERAVPRGIQLIQIKNIQPFYDNPLHLYEGERLADMKCFPGTTEWMQQSLTD